MSLKAVIYDHKGNLVTTIAIGSLSGGIGLTPDLLGYLVSIEGHDLDQQIAEVEHVLDILRARKSNSCGCNCKH